MSNLYCHTCGNTIDDISVELTGPGIETKTTLLPCGHVLQLDDDKNLSLALAKRKMIKMMKETNDIVTSYGLLPIHKEEDFPK